MARNIKRESRVASVDEHGILVRDLRKTLLWIVVAAIVVGLIAWGKTTFM